MKRLFNRCLLRPEDLKPSQEDFRVVGVFNPGVAATSKGVVLLVRVAETPKERRAGLIGLPRWNFDSNRVSVDWVKEDEVIVVDPRVVRMRATGLVRLTFISHLRIVRSRDGREIDSIDENRFEPAAPAEEFGVEDPRITPIENRFYITYVAVSRHGAATALASTADFREFQRHGIIFCPENKDVVLFPERIDGKFLALHRPTTATPFSKPEIWLADSPDLIHWGGHESIRTGGGDWEIGRIGAGVPPIRTREGWLEIYHGNDRRHGDSGIGTYSAGALLLDLENPRLVRRSLGKILTPETEYERRGFVPNVIFPTGVVSGDGTLLIYYGATDTVTAVVELKLGDILDASG